MNLVSVLDDLQIQWIKYARSFEGAHGSLPVRCRRERDTTPSVTGACVCHPMIPKDYLANGIDVGNARYQRDRVSRGTRTDQLVVWDQRGPSFPASVPRAREARLVRAARTSFPPDPITLIFRRVVR